MLVGMILWEGRLGPSTVSGLDSFDPVTGLSFESGLAPKDTDEAEAPKSE